MVHQLTPLPRAAPADQDVDPGAVAAFLDAVEADAEVELHSLMVVRHGHVVAEGWWAPHTADRTRQLFSVSKSVTSTALGMAVAEGLVGLDDTVVSHYPEFADEVTDPRARAMTLRHLATMASGHTREMWPEGVVRDPDRPVRGFLLTPPDVDPGTVFTYNQFCTFVLADVVQRAAGEPLTAYLRPRLLDPLGIGEVGWQAYTRGGPEIGFSGLFARTEDVAKLGQLWLQRGRWGDAQLLPAAYVDEATSKQIETPHEGADHWTLGYGHQFWVSPHGYRADGAFGQFSLVLPEQDAVVAITAGTTATWNVLTYVWTHLLPGFGPGAVPPEPAASAALADRLRGLALQIPDGPVDSGRVPDPFTALAVVEEEGRLVVSLTAPGTVLRVPVGADDWLLSEPRDGRGHPVAVAARSGGPEGGRVRLDVVFLESPHRLELVGDLATGVATGAWRPETMPGLTLHGLHRPGAS